MRYIILGSNMSGSCSFQTLAESDQEALELFNKAMDKDMDVYCSGKPAILNLDNPPKNHMFPDAIIYFCNNFQAGKLEKAWY